MSKLSHLVTSVEEISKSKVKIFIDYEFAFVLYKGELRSYPLKLNEVVSEEVLEEICEKVLVLRGKKRALHLLEKKTYTEKQLRDKLKENLYPKQVIETVLEYVKDYHYVDDLQYAKDYITYYSDYRSRGRIETDLLKKGICRDVIQVACSELKETISVNNERCLIEKILEKKHYDSKSADYVQKQKMMAYLYRKGFCMDMIQQVLE